MVTFWHKFGRSALGVGSWCRDRRLDRPSRDRAETECWMV